MLGALPPAMVPGSGSDPLTDHLCLFFPADLQAASLRQVLGPDAAAQSYLSALACSPNRFFSSHNVTSTQTSPSIYPTTLTLTTP